MTLYRLEHKLEILRPRRDVFDFFSDPFNLERITPAFLQFRIVNDAPVVISVGSRLEYKLALFGVRFGWQTLIEEWKPDESFVDIQLRGPYKIWRHIHKFVELSSDRTLMLDRVDYALPAGPFAKPAHAAFIAPVLRRIFDYRARMIEEMLAPQAL